MNRTTTDNLIALDQLTRDKKESEAEPRFSAVPGRSHGTEYRDSRSLADSAQPAHDAAMLDAIEDWQDATSTAFFNSLVLSSNAKRDYANSLAGHWADWDEATDGKTGEAPDVPTESIVDSIIGILNPFDTESLEKAIIDTDVPRRPLPSEIKIVYTTDGIVSEHTPEEWEVIQEYRYRGKTWYDWLHGTERQRMRDAGFHVSSRRLEEDAPPPKIPTPSILPSAPPILPATPAPTEQPADDTIPVPEVIPQSGLGMTDTIIGVFGGTRGDYVDQAFNFLYGVEDNMSLGIGWWLRSTFFDDQADYGGSSYNIGSWVGFVADLAIGGVFKSIGKVFGKELLEQGVRNAPVRGIGSSGAGIFWKEIDAVLDPTIVKQLHHNACGPASAATLLRSVGVDVGVSKVAFAQKSVLSWKTASLVRVMNKLDSAGGWITDRFQSNRTAFNEITKNGPAGVTLFKFGMKMEHMVVVNGLDDLGRVVIRDPDNGMKYYMNWDEFRVLWTGLAIYR